VKKKETMSKKLFLIVLIAIASFNLTSIATNANNESQVRFICSQGFDRTTGRRYPTTYAWTQRGKIAIVRWKQQWNSGALYTPQQRCQQVSPRFEQAYRSGTLKFLTDGKMNGQPVICTTSSNGGACQTLLMTLQPQEDSSVILEELQGILGGQIAEPLTRNSQRYYQVDIDRFLETASVESSK
jgi:hypothetical protein